MKTDMEDTPVVRRWVKEIVVPHVCQMMDAYEKRYGALNLVRPEIGKNLELLSEEEFACIPEVVPRDIACTIVKEKKAYLCISRVAQEINNETDPTDQDWREHIDLRRFDGMREHFLLTKDITHEMVHASCNIVSQKGEVHDDFITILQDLYQQVHPTKTNPIEQTSEVDTLGMYVSVRTKQGQIQANVLAIDELIVDMMASRIICLPEHRAYKRIDENAYCLAQLFSTYWHGSVRERLPDGAIGAYTMHLQQRPNTHQFYRDYFSGEFPRAFHKRIIQDTPDDQGHTVQKHINLYFTGELATKHSLSDMLHAVYP